VPRSPFPVELAPSILSANFANLAADAQAALDGGGTVLHLDVMDGHFVPNLTIGPPVIASLRKSLPSVTFDCHLMVENPDPLIPAFVEAGASWISVHQEACVHLDRVLHHIADHGCKPGAVINPATPVETLDDVLDIVHHVLVMSVNPGFGGQKFIPNSLKKIARLAQIRESRGLNFRIEVDGGVAHDTIKDVVRAGADLLVAGYAVFGSGNVKENASKLLQAARNSLMARA
jgi:ribulose-phosphate 3-epimerase